MSLYPYLSLFISLFRILGGSALHFLMARAEMEEAGGLTRRDHGPSSPRGILDDDREISQEKEREKEEKKEKEKEKEKEKSKKAG